MDNRIDNRDANNTILKIGGVGTLRPADHCLSHPNQVYNYIEVKDTKL